MMVIPTQIQNEQRNKDKRNEIMVLAFFLSKKGNWQFWMVFCRVINRFNEGLPNLRAITISRNIHD
jgi:hypothetical protein